MRGGFFGVLVLRQKLILLSFGIVATNEALQFPALAGMNGAPSARLASS
ncbi:hypothetical protein ABIA22_005819 [Sinorhizobium fredii]